MTRRWFLGSCLALAVALPGCEDKGKISSEFARKHVEMLVETANGDVEEIRSGLPEGAKHLASLYEGETPPADDREAVRRALSLARSKVQDLRVAKATFFALVDTSGKVLRNDQEQDLMADKDAFGPFPELKAILASRKYGETRGSMEEARGVAKSRKDGQWVAAAPVVVGGTARGLYMAGWAWSSYAYRLEFKLRGEVRSELASEDDARKNEPLLYVHIIVGGEVYGAPVSPAINLETLAKLDLPGKTTGDATHAEALEITGRDFGVASKRAPALGKDVVIAVLRSET
jgi:hypothetical protein